MYLILLLLVVHFRKAGNWYIIWLPLQHTSTTNSYFNGWIICKSTTMFLLGLPIIQVWYVCQVFTISWHRLFYFIGPSSASMMRQNILKRPSNLWNPLITSQKDNEQKYKRSKLSLLVLQNTSRLRPKCPASCPHRSSKFTRKFMSYCTKNLSKSWFILIKLKQHPLTRTSSCIGVLAISLNVLSIQISA